MKESKILKRIVLKLYGGGYIIRFKYYGDFSKLNDIYEDCKNEITYIGQSRLDAAPIFSYEYDYKINNIDNLKKKLRSIKIKFYSGIELTPKEKSILTFMKFFIYSYENYELKGATDYEIKEYISNEQEHED